jgi:hypothetical protein
VSFFWGQVSPLEPDEGEGRDAGFKVGLDLDDDALDSDQGH